MPGSTDGIPAAAALAFEDLAVGQDACLTRVVDRDVAGLVAAIGGTAIGGTAIGSGAMGAMSAAAGPVAEGFGPSVAHGLVAASLVATLLGTRLPGPGAVYLSQNLQFLGPVAPGDALVARVEVVELVRARRRARLFCECAVGDRVVLEGEAWVALAARASPPPAPA
ncbi:MULTISPECIES: MaoC/PaaZ C-terminal domain-containing protein [Methylobacterium]|uniref:(R)-specific enoyl-CoA hydratase n=1 Tax=Methylobacterium isbiliense TaxID=315478 RepID=A0ABQ4SDE0_9HYPH|nr:MULTISPECIES: MaoC/PaaZ C-terminal domain-containing protein [Methylobacterium]MBY0296822.1 acyl dehydratase [Methylobacterium sp.]MDN3622766.1 MaoC/PaaZ C-terminal domain-containing protein [Methylobacterium isbiliense]GJD99837.1 (R)-specific enoyl-CoA hydratase [Methylobacterium isbiliense]